MTVAELVSHLAGMPPELEVMGKLPRGTPYFGNPFFIVDSELNITGSILYLHLGEERPRRLIPSDPLADLIQKRDALGDLD